MRESELLEHVYARSAGLAGAFPGVVAGPGDDCAVVRTPGGDELLLKVDQVVEGRHFAPGTPVDLIARKAVSRAVSDIAAMAGTPRWGLAAGVLPPSSAHADELFDRLAHWARHWAMPLVGGDISSGPAGCPLVLGITGVGVPHATRGPVLRSTAKPGDELWVTGRIGGSLASGRHQTFEPRLREAAWLADTLGPDLHAMLDVSDGLGIDAGRMAAASGVRIVIEARAVPLHPEAKSVESAIADGEDYELLFAAAPSASKSLSRQREENPPLSPFTCIGRIEPGQGCVLMLPDGRQLDASHKGWEHGCT